MGPIQHLLAKSGFSDIIVFGVIVLIMLISSLVKWLRAKQAEGEIKERSVQRGDRSEGAQIEPQRVDGLASLLEALAGSAKAQQEPGYADEDDAWSEAEAPEGPVMHEVESEVWSVNAETEERGLTTMDPHTIELQTQRRQEERQRERERRREASAAAERRIAEEERRARQAVESIERARSAAAARGYASPDVSAEHVLEAEAVERARRLAAALEGGLAGGVAALGAPSDLSPSDLRATSREAVRRGMVWSFVLGAPRGMAPHGGGETGGVPGLRS